MIEFWFQILAFCKAIGALAVTKPLNLLGILFSFVLFIKLAEPFLLQWRYEKEMLDKKKISTTQPINPSLVSTGDISVTGNKAPTQISVGSPGSIQIVNQRRAILPNAKIEKGKEGNNFLLRVVLTQTTGIWDQGTDFKLQVKTTGPFESSRIIRGFPPAQFNVRISENKEHGYYAYFTSTAPIKDEPIVLEILSKEEINISQLGIEPLQQ